MVAAVAVASMPRGAEREGIVAIGNSVPVTIDGRRRIMVEHETGLGLVSPLANVHSSAFVGLGAIVCGGVRLGRRAYVSGNIVLGEGVTVSSGTMLVCATQERLRLERGTYSGGLFFHGWNNPEPSSPELSPLERTVQHEKGFGRVADENSVAESAWVGKSAVVERRVRVAEDCSIFGRIRLAGRLVLSKNAVVSYKSATPLTLEGDGRFRSETYLFRSASVSIS